MTSLKTLEDKIQFDHEHIWHPYASLLDPAPCLHVESANGTRIKLSDGTELIEGMSSWWCAVHGYNHPELNKAATDQISKMSHVMFGSLTHDPAIYLVERLLRMTDPKLDCCFLADSGSVAVEVSLKLALQYSNAIDKPDKKKFLTVRNGYHGDTFGAMSVCDPVNSMHTLYSGYMTQNIFAEAPQLGYFDEWNESDVADFENKIKQNHDVIAAVIMEPILQGAGGMRIYHPQYLKRVRQLCDHYKVLLIFDEIATGFGRTGKLFASQHSDVVPDIMLVGKALTGGYMTLSAVLCQKFVGNAISHGKQTGGMLMHGPTFMGNPLACAVACKSLELLERGDWIAQVSNIEKLLKEGLSVLQTNPIVKNVRVLGAVGVVELTVPVEKLWFQELFVRKHGVWIRPFGKLVYLMPPYIITEQELGRLIDALIDVVGLYEKRLAAK